MGKCYEHVSSTERAVTQMQIEVGINPAAIAWSLNRSVSEVTRELRRNGWKPQEATPKG